MGDGIIFHDDSIGNWVAVRFFIILTMLIPLAVSMSSSRMRDKMQYKRGKNDFKYHMILFFIIGMVGVFCLNWKKNKIDTQ